MEVIVDINGKITCGNSGGTQNENNVKELKITVPEQYKDFNKKIVFKLGNKLVWDIIENDVYLIKKAISKHESVSFYIWLTKDEMDFRSELKVLKFITNYDCSKQITQEEIDGVNTIVNILDLELAKVSDLEKELYTKLENGEFIGEQGEKGDRGDKGDTGNSGVYIGEEEPTDENINVWIIPKGEPDGATEVTADTIIFSDGDNLQEKLNSGELKGEKGDKGETGEAGSDVVISATEPTGDNREKVWIQKGDTEQKIYVKNDNDVYEEFISKEDTLVRYSTEERKIGTWTDGKPLYRKIIKTIAPAVSTDGSFASYYTEVSNAIEHGFIEWAFITDIDNQKMYMPYTTNGGYTIKCFINKDNAFATTSNVKSFSEQPVVASILYTKTTD